MKVAVIMGSISDRPVVEKTYGVLRDFAVDVELRVISAHRTPEVAREFALNAEEAGIDVIIAAAGKAAHLAGVLAASTTLPVIGLPIQSSALDGLDALLATVQMPKGVPVATVAINGAENAAYLACQILAVKDERIRKLLKEHKQKMADEIIEVDEQLTRSLLES